MLSFINHIVDRCFFTLAFLLGVQIPAFIEAYLQRLSGHVDEAQIQLQQFEQLAKDHYDGKIELLIRSYKSNSEQAIIDTGTAIEVMVNRLTSLQAQFSQLNTPNYIEKLKAYISAADINISKQTIELFTPAIPLTTNALVTGLTIAIIATTTKLILERLTRHLIKQLWGQPNY